MIIADATEFGHMSGYGWGLMAFWMILGIVLIGALVWAILRSESRQATPPSPSRPSPSDILAERFARGEIDEDEYRRRRSALE
jgi:putative membrane protein